MWLSPKLTGPGYPTGQRSLHHRGDTLETLVLLNPSDKSLCDEVGKGRLLGGAGCWDERHPLASPHVSLPSCCLKSSCHPAAAKPPPMTPASIYSLLSADGGSGWNQKRLEFGRKE